MAWARLDELRPGRPAGARGTAVGDGGQAAVIVVALLVVLLAMGGLVAVRVGGAASERARARTAADAAALAGVVAGDGAAREVAERNGARLVQLTRSGGEVEVVVERAGRRATARARPQTGSPDPHGVR